MKIEINKVLELIKKHTSKLDEYNKYISSEDRKELIEEIKGDKK